MAYLTVDQFKNLSVMPAEYIDALEQVAPGWVQSQLEYWSAWINSRLRKRYDAPFAEPYPEAVTGWLARIVTVRCWLRRGVDPQDEQFREVKDDATAAQAEIQEAADAVEGLFDLPLRANTTASGISKGFPRGYSEQSPYVWTDEQGRVGRDEDRAGRGTDV